MVRYESLDNAYSAPDILRYAATLEQGSEHPIATGIVAKSQELGFTPFTAHNTQSVTGEGIYGVIEGKNMGVITPRLIDKQARITNNGNETIVYVVVNKLPI